MFSIATLKHPLTKKHLWLYTIIFFLFSGISYAKNYEVRINAGAEREILNYENESDNLIIRGGTSVKLSELFIFNYTTLRNIDEKTCSYTWNLTLKDIGSFMNFMAGNYTLHFGSGLMMGRKSYSSRDPFTKKISISKDEAISPANGGNPEYSFFGTAFSVYKIFEEIKLSFLPFFSNQRRFITAESYESRAIESSLFTLNTKIRQTGNNTETVNIINYGGLLELKAVDLFTLQLYCFDTDLRGDSGENILWDKGKYNYGEGVDLIRNCGLFAEYADRNISFFAEPSMSSIYSEKTITDYAITWGMGIRNYLMNFSLRGKNTGTDFHSENSSGSRTPERIWETRYALYPAKCLETGIIIYSEKDLTPAYNKDYVEGSLQEEIFGAISTDLININLDIKRKSHYSTDLKDPVDQGTVMAGISPSDRFFIKLRSSMQKSSGDISRLAGGEMKIMFLEYFSLAMGYTRITVKGETPFYAVITPASEHSSVTSFRESAHCASVKFRYKKDRDSFYIRFSVNKTKSEQDGQAESAIVIVF